MNAPKRLLELLELARAGQISDEEFEELEMLTKAKRQAIENRRSLIRNVRANLDAENIGINDLFKMEEILAAANALSENSVGTRDEPSSSKQFTRTGSVLLEVKIPGGRGSPCKYCLGQDLPRAVPKSLKGLDDGNLEANLTKRFTDAGKTYFITEQGKEELARLIEFIRAGPTA